MFRSYLTSAFRNLVKDRLYAAINTVGLAIGLATGFILYSWVQLETSFDSYHANADQIYRVTTHWTQDPSESHATAFPMIKTRVLDRFPEVEASVRVFDRGFLGDKTRIIYQENSFTDEKLYYADSTFFRVYPFQILKGNSRKLFQHANAVILTESTARRYFGDDNPLDKILWLGGDKALVVTGVMEDISQNTHFNFDLLLNMESHSWIKHAEANLWSGIVFHTYAKLRSGTNPSELQSKINAYLADFPDDKEHYGQELHMVLQPIEDIHLYSAKTFELMPNGDIRYVYLFMTIALLVVVVAVINYINLASARYAQRTKEVGIRKTMGANRPQLVVQFLSESLLVACVSFVLALLLIQTTQPLLVGIMEVDFLRPVYEPQTLLKLAGFSISVGVIAGFFPSIVLSSFRPTELLRPKISIGRGFTLRQALVVFQFTVSILLTVCTAFIYRQLNFIQQTNVGYDRDHVVALYIGYPGLVDSFEILKNNLLSNSSIVNVAATSQLPTNILTSENIDVVSGENYGVYYLSIDKDFFRTMNIPIIDGSEGIESLTRENYQNRYVLSESALQMIGWSPAEAMAQQISIRHGNMKPGPVIGVVNDFQFQSLHYPTAPIVFEFTPGDFQYLLIRIKPNDIKSTISTIKGEWEKVVDAIPFDYTFLDQEFNRMYQTERRAGALFMIFAGIASFIALLGLFALASFFVARKTQEIGIRKVLGATTRDIIKLVSRDFSLLISIAIIIALPVSYYFMSEWLEAFAYKTDLSIMIFVLAGSVNLVLAFATLTYHSMKAANTNPVDTVKME